VTVDGETSTSDTVLLLANGRAGHAPLRDAASAGAKRFAGALGELTQELARAIARDGEGATKLVTVRVSGAKTAEDAARAAKRIANSMLVKTALFGGDPNWGASSRRLAPRAWRSRWSAPWWRSAGWPCFATARRRRRRAAPGGSCAGEEGCGGRPRPRRRSPPATVWTCDLSYDYVKINAEYTT